MTQVSWAVVFALSMTYSISAQTKVESPIAIDPSRQPGRAVSQEVSKSDAPALDAEREKQALKIFLKSVERQIVSAAEAMPAVKYSFAPTDGEFKGVRTFAQQVKHLAATNNILAAAALGEEPPADAGDEQGPENVRSKPEILDYLNLSFVHLGKAIDAIGENGATVRPSPISPLPANKTTRLGLTVEALIHAFNHYGQMVEYLRMNGVVPPCEQAMNLLLARRARRFLGSPSRFETFSCLTHPTLRLVTARLPRPSIAADP